MHILVAGGAGYIGAVLVPSLLVKGHRVTVLDRLYFGDTLVQARATFGQSLRVIRGDTRWFSPGILDGVDAVVDVAGISNDPACEMEPELTRSINVDGGKRLATLARKAGVRRYVYSSSCSVYGHGEGLGLTETSVRNPVSTYARSKVEVEDYALSLGRDDRNFGVVALRLATVFGLSPRMRFDLAVNVMTKNAYVARRITIDGGGRQWRPFVHVADVAEAFEKAVTADDAHVAGQVFNVGSTANNVRILNLAFRVRDRIPGTEIVHAPTDPDARDYNVAFSKVAEALEFRPSRSIDDGIAEVLKALRDDNLDPDDRRFYTIKQYLFLHEAEQAMRELALEGRLLASSESQGSA